MLMVEIHWRKGDLEKALELVETLAEERHVEVNDVAVQVRLLNLKARLLAETGHPLKGFSLATRAAQIAYRARVLPALWEAVGLLANILNHLREFGAAMELLHAIMPQVLECQDRDLAARSYSVLADASMGLAGLEPQQSTKQKEFISRAMEHIEQAYVQYRYIEDLKGQLGMLRKKATVMHWRGDLVLANDTATQYLELNKQYAALRV
jgi:anaphase-promoting complex subunit 5